MEVCHYMLPFMPSYMEVREHNFTHSRWPRAVTTSFKCHVPGAFRDS